MTLLSILLNPWLHTISALLAPFALRTLPMFRKPSSPTPPSSQHLLVRHAPLRAPITALLALYALYTLHTLAFARPPNLFTTLHLPLNAPQSAIRATLLRRNYMSSMVGMKTGTANGGAAMPELPPALEKLLARLASFDARTILVRFGQRAIQTCTHCTSEADYALHALPPALLSYTLAVAMLGAVTVRGTARESRRGIGLMLLIVAALVEAYWAYTIPVRISSRPRHQGDSPDDVIMWHDTLWSLRHALFLALPLSVHLLPAPSQPPAPPLTTTLPLLSQTTDTQLARAHLLRLSTAATQRIPELRARTMAFWARERALGAALRHDTDVRVAAERVGLGIAPPLEGRGGTSTSTRALLGSRDHKEALRAGEGEGGLDVAGGRGGEGALHKAARAAVAALKESILRSPPPPSDGGAPK